MTDGSRSEDGKIEREHRVAKTIGVNESAVADNGAGGQFLLGALFLLCSVMTDIDKKHRNLWIVGEGIPAVIAVFLFPVIGVYFAGIVFLDAVSNLSVKY